MGLPMPAAARLVLHRAALVAERGWDRARLARAADRPPRHFRIVTFLGLGAGEQVVLRGRVLDNPEPPGAVEGDSVWTAVRRTLSAFLTDELPGVPLRVRLGAVEASAVTDSEGYFEMLLAAGLPPTAGPWALGEVELAGPYRGLTQPHTTPVRVRVPGPTARFGVVSDIDDTILRTGAQRTAAMVLQTLTGSELTRMTFPGAPELYRALERGPGDDNPFYYVSSSPWNLHGFLTAFLRHRGFPLGPLLLRDLLGADARRTHASHKAARIAEILDLHPALSFVLVGDSGQHDPEIYADIVRRFPGRILAVYIREVRLDPDDGRVETLADAWDADVPFVLAAGSAEVARHAAGLGLLSEADVAVVEAATEAGA